jgi:hypothetical protein
MVVSQLKPFTATEVENQSNLDCILLSMTEAERDFLIIELSRLQQCIGEIHFQGFRKTRLLLVKLLEAKLMNQTQIIPIQKV